MRTAVLLSLAAGFLVAAETPKKKELKRDTLKLCWDQQAKENGRPTQFVRDKGKTSVHYLVLKREKK
jgi:hypothetical protein